MVNPGQTPLSVAFQQGHEEAIVCYSWPAPGQCCGIVDFTDNIIDTRDQAPLIDVVAIQGHMPAVAAAAAECIQVLYAVRYYLPRRGTERRLGGQ